MVKFLLSLKIVNKLNKIIRNINSSLNTLRMIIRNRKEMIKLLKLFKLPYFMILKYLNNKKRIEVVKIKMWSKLLKKWRILNKDKTNI
jgi:hypothetical protein